MSNEVMTATELLRRREAAEKDFTERINAELKKILDVILEQVLEYLERQR